MTAYYNEFDPYAAQWLRNQIDEGLIAPGVVDERSITEVTPADLAGFTQCHFFAGIGGWSHAARLAGWADDRPLWTGSPPCQSFSVAGKQLGYLDPRDLWPTMFNLIAACRPETFMGEQVASAVRFGWLDRVFADMEGADYAIDAAVLPACAVNAPHRRDRLWIVAHTDNEGPQGQCGNVLGAAQGRGKPDRPVAPSRLLDRTEQSCSPVADTNSERGQVDSDAGRRAPGSGTREVAGLGGASVCPVADANGNRCEPGDASTTTTGHWGSAESKGSAGYWDSCDWIIGHDGKARRVEPSIRLLAHGVPNRVGRLRAYGNAIVPQVAAEVIRAHMESLL